MHTLAGDDFPVSQTEGAPCRGSQRLRVDRALKRSIVRLEMSLKEGPTAILQENKSHS